MSWLTSVYFTSLIVTIESLSAPTSFMPMLRWHEKKKHIFIIRWRQYILIKIISSSILFKTYLWNSSKPSTLDCFGVLTLQFVVRESFLGRVEAAAVAEGTDILYLFYYRFYSPMLQMITKNSVIHNNYMYISS